MIIMKVKVMDAYEEDIGKGIIRIDSDLESELNFGVDDIVKISNPTNNRKTAAKLKIGKSSDKNSKTVRIDANLRRNLGASIDDYVEICNIDSEIAKEVIFTCQNPNFTFKNTNHFAKKLENRIITKGDIFSFKYNGKIINLIVSNYTPKFEAVTIRKNTSIIIQDAIPQKVNNTDLYILYNKLNYEIKDLKCKIDEINKELVNLKQI